MPTPEFFPVESSNISAIAYDLQTKDLYVRFKNAKQWRYKNVPPAIHRAMMRDESKGRFLTQNIKPFFEGELASPMDDEEFDDHGMPTAKTPRVVGMDPAKPGTDRTVIIPGGIRTGKTTEADKKNSIRIGSIEL